MKYMYSRLRRILSSTLVMAATLSFALMPFAAQANTLDNKSTVLNYLIEVDRQTGKGCNNETTKLPSLTPSADLTEIADIIATSDTQLDQLLTLRGMDKATIYSAFVTANTAQEAVKKFRLANCSQLLSSRYSRIGSNQHGTKWTIVLAGDQRIPANEASSDIIVNPYEPSEPASQTSQPSLTPPPATPSKQGSPSQTNRQTHGKYADGEPVFLPEQGEQREPATPQVTGVYTDDTLTPVKGAQPAPSPTAPEASVAPQPTPKPQAAPVSLAPQTAPRQEGTPSKAMAADASGSKNRQTHGKYADGEPVFLPEQSEHRDAATPQVTGVYDDYTLTPEKVENMPAPAAPLAPQPDYPESNRDPNDAAPPQVTGVYVE